MKTHFIVLSAIVLCFVENGNSGVISDVLGNIRHETVEAKDGVQHWITFGKDWVFGTNKPAIKGRNADELEPRDGLFSDIYNSILDVLSSARDKILGFFVIDDKGEYNGFISEVSDKVKDEIHKPIDVTEVMEPIHTIINEQYEHEDKPVDNVEEGIEEHSNKDEEAHDNIHENVEEMKDDVSDVLNSEGDNAARGVNIVTDSIDKEVNEAKESLTSTLTHLEQSGIEISEQEREVLNAISNRIQNKIANIQDANEDTKEEVI